MDAQTPPPSGFVELVEEHLGLHSEVPTSHGWSSILKQRLGATRSLDFDAYRQRLSSPVERREEIGQLAQMLTVGETYFFRDSRQFEAITTVILPELLNRRSHTTKVQVLSVACSTGEEPYSVAIAAREVLGHRAERVEVRAFDINPNSIAAAQRATYSEWALRATPAGIRNRYFVQKANQFTLSSDIRNAVQFEARNLFDADSEFWRAGRFDVILCRNVLIYFSRRRIVDALRQLANVLPSDGTLLLGNAETPRGYENGLVPRELCGTFCYRVADCRNEPAANWPAMALRDSAVPTAPNAELANTPSVSKPDDIWVTAIEAATKRLASLVQGKPTNEPTPGTPAAGCDVNELLQEARRMTQAERFSEALSKLDQIVAVGHESSEVHLLRASILTNQGNFTESVDLCHRLLADFPHCAGAYHLLGVACEHQGKLEEARSHHETAITLDSGFIMSHWLLGRLCLRAGRRDAARRHLDRALELWRLEASPSGPNSEIYAGGFGRETLERLCRADLAKCEVRR